jgi:hypothetical protein
MLLRPVEWEQRLFVFSYPERGAIFGPRDNFDKKIPMGLERFLVGSEQLGDPGIVMER